MKSGIELIAAERQRQIDEEGWSVAHDDEHDAEELAIAAICYLACDCFAEDVRKGAVAPAAWPWHPEWWKPTPNDRVRELVKAGALYLAEAERLRRCGNRPKARLADMAAKIAARQVDSLQRAERGER